MVSTRTLPSQRNPLVAPENSPSLEILIERRRLGQTQLNIKAPNVVKGAATGTFDYAHLRVPLPKDLSGSEIFALKNMSAYPESYFLMRRSSDGYITLLPPSVCVLQRAARIVSNLQTAVIAK